MDAGLNEHLLGILRSHPEGISEYDLIQELRERGSRDFPESAFRDNLALFRLHFHLFHQLYLLREQLAQAAEGSLEITPLRITLLPYRESTRTQLGRPDPLRDYYLDSKHLAETAADEVDAMLDKFWQRLGSGDQRQQALAELGLEDPVDDATIKKQYRRLAMHHHPDRGGDNERLQVINAAMAVLQRR